MGRKRKRKKKARRARPETAAAAPDVSGGNDKAPTEEPSPPAPESDATLAEEGVSSTSAASLTSADQPPPGEDEPLQGEDDPPKGEEGEPGTGEPPSAEGLASADGTTTSSGSVLSKVAQTADDTGREQAPKPQQEPPSRRVFLARAGTLVLGACGVGAGVSAMRFAMPQAGAAGTRQLAVGNPAEFKLRTLTWIREHDLFVLREDAGYGAFSARCTHLGCIVQRTADGFACPCHGATFDALGAVLTGPARDNLPWYAIWLERDGRLWVDPSKVVDPVLRSLAELRGQA